MLVPSTLAVARDFWCVSIGLWVENRLSAVERVVTDGEAPAGDAVRHATHQRAEPRTTSPMCPAVRAQTNPRSTQLAS